tara:strand:+ start:307 stop:1203 length:897 start_codon:yes stop_codon:yes gene_type:complete
MKYNLNLDLGVDKIYVINLKKHKERKEDMIQMFAKYNILNYEFIEAIHGDDLPPIPQLISKGILNKYWVDPQGILTYNIIACAMSHRKAVDTFLNSENKTCLILEDDVIFDDDFFIYCLSGEFDKFKKQIKESKADIVLWGKQRTQYIKGEQTEYSELLKNATDNEFSAHAYQIHRESAHKLFDSYYPLKFAADTNLDFGGFDTLCSKISLIQQSQGKYNQKIINDICESVHRMNNKIGFDSATQPDRFSAVQYFYTNKNMPIDYVSRRNFKTPNGVVHYEVSIIYFKTDERNSRKLD